jgi:hypothetical protein
MSDAAFKPPPYASYTSAQLRDFIKQGRGNETMLAEIERRDRRDAGDRSVMTAGERLRHPLKS